MRDAFIVFNKCSVEHEDDSYDDSIVLLIMNRKMIGIQNCRAMVAIKESWILLFFWSVEASLWSEKFYALNTYENSTESANIWYPDGCREWPFSAITDYLELWSVL